jgi:hypothetical protein
MCLLSLSGCDKIKSMLGMPVVADPKELDAQAIGYACRVSKKQPEACMKENEIHSPSQILSGWKSADKDIKAKVIDAGPNSESAAIAVSAVSAASAVSPAKK